MAQIRELVDNLTNTGLSNSAFPFGTWQNLYIGHAPCWAQRVSFTGELGWEIYVTPDFADYVLQLFLENDQELGLRLMRGETLNALRIEKGYLHWGHDLSYTDAPHQLGLEFLCKTNKAQHLWDSSPVKNHLATVTRQHGIEPQLEIFSCKAVG